MRSSFPFCAFRCNSLPLSFHGTDCLILSFRSTDGVAIADKDTFISNSSSEQKGGRWAKGDSNQWPYFKAYRERNAATHALMSLLSMASVTFGDAAGESNRTLLMQLIRADGVLLKADRPATAIDAQFQAMMFGSWPGKQLPKQCGAARPSSGALPATFTKAEIESMFPSSSGRSALGARRAAATSTALMEQVQARQALDKQCRGGYGSPQSPVGEVYSTHTTVSGMTWRYLVSVQVAEAFNVTATALGIPADSADAVTYTYDDATLWRIKATSDISPLGGGLLVAKSPEEECDTSPELNITTRCARFELRTVAVVASNGWVLLGEVDKFIPVSNQRISAVHVIPSGGFSLALRGAPGEAVTMGAAKVAAGGAVSYKTATIGSDGTAVLQLGDGGL